MAGSLQRDQAAGERVAGRRQTRDMQEGATSFALQEHGSLAVWQIVLEGALPPVEAPLPTVERHSTSLTLAVYPLTLVATALGVQFGAEPVIPVMV
jgi:hypothetical protein